MFKQSVLSVAVIATTTVGFSQVSGPTRSLSGLSSATGWEIEEVDDDGVDIQFGDDAILLVAEPSELPRRQYRANRRVSLGGDFDISVRFDLDGPLPAPSEKWLSLELVLRGSTASINMARTHHFGSGNGVSTSIRFKGTDARGNFWRLTPTTPSSGVLRITRTDDQIGYWIRALPENVLEESSDSDQRADAPPSSGDFELIGQTSYSGRVWGVTLALNLSSPMNEAISARFSDFQLHGGFRAKPDSGAPRSELLFLAVAGAVGAFLLGVGVSRITRRGY